MKRARLWNSRVILIASERMRRIARPALTLLGLLAVGSCGEVSPGEDPPANRFGFPNGLLLDPRISSEAGEVCTDDSQCGEGECASGLCRASARWLLVSNANSDLRYNAGSLVPIDLDAFWDEFEGAAVLPAGARLTNALGERCRQVANLPQVVECEESFFAKGEATVYYGNFPGPPEPWVREGETDEATLLIPVRGDPSVTWIEMRGGLAGDDLELDCGQSSGTGGCDDRHRLRFLRNDPDAGRMSREPFRIHVSEQADLPYAYVAHGVVGSADPDFTLVALEGLEVEGDGLPVIVDDRLLFSSSTLNGGMGVAQRPCDVASDNAPASSLGCTRPRVYGAVRWNRPLTMQVATIIRHAPIEPQFCAAPDELDLMGAISCDARVEAIRRFSAGGISTESVGVSLQSPFLGDIEFSAGGDELYVVQSNPGGLLRIDTSLGEDDEPRDVPVAQVEVCARPTSLALYEDGESRLGLVTCYRSGELFLVDLASLTVVGLVRVGTGPDAMAVDLAREVVYVANSLDATISVVDLSPTAPTRFTELARIGLQEPYTG